MIPACSFVLLFSPFCFWTHFLTILLPDIWYHESLSTWLPISAWNNVLCICPGLHLAPFSDVTVRPDLHGASRPSPASSEAESERRHSGVPTTTAAGCHAACARHDTPDGGPLHLGLGRATSLRSLGTIHPFCTHCSSGSGRSWDLGSPHYRLPPPASSSPAYPHLRGTTANLEASGASWHSASSCSSCNLAPSPRRPPG